MNIPASFVLGSRRLGGEGDEAGKYVSFLDCTFIKEPGDPLISSAEIAHRWIALQTSIGRIAFLSELVLNLAFARVANEQVPSGNELLAERKRLIGCLLNDTRTIFRSYEVLDEVFSALMTRGCLLRDNQNQRIEELESDLRDCYPRQIFPTYQRAREIMKWTDSNPASTARWMWVFTDAANVPADDPSSVGLSDRRLEFFLTAAEQAMKTGVPPTQLIEFLHNAGQDHGHEIKRLKIDTHGAVRGLEKGVAKVLEHLGQPTIMNSENYFPMESFYEDSTRILESRLRDADAWDPFDWTIDWYTHSSLVAFPRDTRWSFWFDRRHDELTRKALQHHFEFTILRNAILCAKAECPLALLATNTKPPRPLCYSHTDDRCMFRNLRFLSPGNRPLEQVESPSAYEQYHLWPTAEYVGKVTVSWTNRVDATENRTLTTREKKRKK
jgi:hypothetical protein